MTLSFSGSGRYWVSSEVNVPHFTKKTTNTTAESNQLAACLVSVKRPPARKSIFQVLKLNHLVFFVLQKKTYDHHNMFKYNVNFYFQVPSQVLLFTRT